MPNSYKTGTVSVTNGSAIVTGAGTAFNFSNVAGGRFVLGAFEAEVLSVQSATQLTLDTPFVGTTASGQAYRIWLQDAQAASNITINQQLGVIIARLVNSAPEIQDFLDAPTAASGLTSLGISAFIQTLLDDANQPAALATLGANNAANLNAGILPDARLPARLGLSAMPIADFNLAINNGWYISTTSTPTNSPEANWTFCRVHSWGTTYTLQEAFSIDADSDADTRAYRREQNNGVWGAWTRIRSSQTEMDSRYCRIADDIHEFRNPDDNTLSMTIEAIPASVGRWVVMGAPLNFGPSLSVSGTATNIDGYISPKGTGGLIIGNALGRMLEVLAGAASFITDRILQIKPGSTGAGELASLNAIGGMDFKASGSPLMRLVSGLGNAIVQIKNTSANYVTIASGTGDGLVLSSDLGMQFKGVAYETWDYTAHDVANGGTVTINQFGGYQWIRPTGGAIAGCTIALPATPEDGTVVHINTRSAITTITWTAGAGGVLNAPTTMSSSTPVAFQYRGTTFGWERVH